MIYYEDMRVIIRDMCVNDARILTDGEIAQGWNADIEKYEIRLKDQAEGRAVSLVAEYEGNVAGYVNVYKNSQWGALGGAGYPEIVDFGVLEKYRKHGVGSLLMDAAERIASAFADRVYLGVGLHAGYGSAQRMYVKRGYVPDGSGVWYKDRVLAPYAPCVNDDDLILYMFKFLSAPRG